MLKLMKGHIKSFKCKCMAATQTEQSAAPTSVNVPVSTLNCADEIK